MLWKIDPKVEAARKLPGWGPFHYACQQERFYFDHCEKQGREYKVLCYSVDAHWHIVPLVEGRGSAVLDAYRDAHERCGRATTETTAALDTLIAGPPADDFMEMLG